MMWLKIGSAAMFLAVALGAFAAHALKSKLGAYELQVFETGVRYHMYHALALFVVAWAADRFPHPMIEYAGWMFTTGIVIFSGSLYVLALTGVRAWGAVTPLGGAAFLAGWFLLFLRSFK